MKVNKTKLYFTYFWITRCIGINFLIKMASELSIKTSKDNRIGYFYIHKVDKIRTSNKIITINNDNIGKIGVTEEPDPFTRFNNYLHGTELVIYYKIQSLYENETKVIEMCNSKYKVDIEEFRCKEYFQGHIVSLVQDVYDIIKEDIIEICNLDHDIINSKFRKINIYFDDFINVKYFEYVKKYLNIENVEMNKEFRHDTQRYILYHYKQELLKSLSDEEIENIKTGKKIKKEKEKEKKLIDINVPVYICHHCVDYYTYSISDMIKHNKRKTKCKQNNNINYNDAIILNKNKYVFKFDTKDLTTDNIKYIISNYNNEMTIINNAVFDKNIIKKLMLNLVKKVLFMLQIIQILNI